jgi:hypothetical protein
MAKSLRTPCTPHRTAPHRTAPPEQSERIVVGEAPAFLQLQRYSLVVCVRSGRVVPTHLRELTEVQPAAAVLVVAREYLLETVPAKQRNAMQRNAMQR